MKPQPKTQFKDLSEMDRFMFGNIRYRKGGHRTAYRLKPNGVGFTDKGIRINPEAFVKLCA